MPLGSFRLNSLARYIAAIPAPVAEDTSSKYLAYNGDAKISTSQSKTGGSSFEFAGSGQYLEVEYEEDFLHGYQDQTIELWFYARSWSRSNTAVYLPNQISLSSGSGYGVADFNWAFGTIDNGDCCLVRKYITGTDILTVTTLSLDAWHHIAFTWDNSTGLTKIFVNGTMYTPFDRGNPMSTTPRNLRIGVADPANGAALGTGHDGFIDNIRISNTIRYTGNFTPPSTSFTWDEDTALLLNADSFNTSKVASDDNGGRLALNLTEPTGSSVTVSDTQKKFGDTSLYFPGTGTNYIGSIYRTNNTALPIELIKWYNDPGWTLEFWMYTTNMDSLTPNDVTSGGGLVGQRYDNNNPGGQWWGFGPRRDGEVRFTAFAGPHRNFVTSAAGITANNWHHVAAVFTYAGGSIANSNFKIFVNGVAKYDQTIGSDTPYIAGDDNTYDIIGFTIGQNLTVTGDNFTGYVDELRVSKTARYSSTFTPQASAFVNDANTVLLLHGNGTAGKRVVKDDNSRVA